MRRYLLVLDRDLATADEPKPGPVSYLAARQEEEPCEVVVLGLVRSRQAQLPAFMRLRLSASIGRYGRATLPGHDVRAAAHRMTSSPRAVWTSNPRPSRWGFFVGPDRAHAQPRSSS